MKKIVSLFVISVLASGIAFAQDRQILWNFTAAPNGGNFNDDANWTGLSAPYIGGGDSVRFAGSSFWAEQAVVYFGASTTISQTTLSAGDGAFWIRNKPNTGDNPTLTFEPQSFEIPQTLTIVSTTDAFRIQDASNLQTIFKLPVIFQTTAVTDKTRIHVPGSPLGERGGNLIFEDFRLRGIYDAETSGETILSTVQIYTYNTGAWVDIQNLSNYYTKQGDSDTIPTSTGNLEVTGRTAAELTTVRIGNADNFTGKITLNQNATLILGSNLPAAITLEFNYSTVWFEEAVTTFSHAHARKGKYDGMTYGTLAGTVANPNTVTMSSPMTCWGGGGWVAFAAQANSTLTFTGNFLAAYRQLYIDGTGGTVLLDAAAWAGVGSGGRNRDITTVRSGAILGGKGNVKWDMTTIVNNGGKLTNEYGSISFVNTVKNFDNPDGNRNWDNSAVTLDLSAVATAGSFLFTLNGELTTGSFFADVLILGNLDSDKFVFTLGPNFGGSGEYTLFSAGDLTPGTLDTSSFAIATDVTGNLAWSADGKSLVLNVVAIPEPAAFALIAFGAVAIAALRRSRRKS